MAGVLGYDMTSLADMIPDGVSGAMSGLARLRAESEPE